MNDDIKIQYIPYKLKGDPIYNFLKDLKDYYPDFDEWYQRLYIPPNGITTHLKLDRAIIIARKPKIINKTIFNARISNISDEIVGVLILKNNKQENKICTLKVLDEYQKQGIGSRLIMTALTYIGDKDIKISVCEENEHKLIPILNKFNFLRIERYKKDNNKYEIIYERPSNS